jgi:serine/threonine protein kinase
MAERFGRYWLHKKIGHGGMAEVFRATIGPDPETYAFDVALKRLHSHLEGDQSQVDMFLTEADVAKFLRHPNLVRVYESGIEAGRAFIAMEHIWGHDLARLFGILDGRGVRFPSDLAVFVALQLLRALDYVHRARSPGGVPMDLVHRDVNPSNVFVTLSGEVKLGDFGVARVSFLEPQEDASTLKGKAGYMPPEVLGGEPVDQAVDLWGVAVMLYEMLTAQRLWGGVTDGDLMLGAEPPEIVPVERVSSDVDPKLARIVNRALSRRVKKRPPDALTFYQQLKLYLRDTGGVVDAQAMSRFAAEMTGSTPEKAHGEVDTSSFGLPEYEVPIGLSPTQRFEQRARTRARTRPLLLLGALVVIAMVAFGVYRLWPPAVEAPATPPTPAAASAPAATSAPAAASAPEAASASPDPPTPQPAVESDPPGSADYDANDVDAEAADRGEGSNLGGSASRFRALVQRGRVQLRRGKAESALAAFRSASALKPDHTGARLGRASALLSLGRHDDAERQVNAVLERKPRSGSAFLLLGEINVARGNSAQARWAFERCLEVVPRDGKLARSARNALGKL